MAELPTGTVTFLFTDLEGFDPPVGGASRRDARGARPPRRDPARRGRGARRPRRQDHRRRRPRGVRRPRADALDAAVDAQRALADERVGAARSRSGCGWGCTPATAELRDGDYYGTAVNRAARVVGRGARRPDRRVARDRRAGPRPPRRRRPRRPRRAPAARPGPARADLPGRARRARRRRSRRCGRSTRSRATSRVQVDVASSAATTTSRGVAETLARLALVTHHRRRRASARPGWRCRSRPSSLPHFARRRLVCELRGRDSDEAFVAGRRGHRSASPPRPGDVARGQRRASTLARPVHARGARQLRAPARRRGSPGRAPCYATAPTCGSSRRAGRASRVAGRAGLAAAVALGAPMPTRSRRRSRRARRSGCSSTGRRRPGRDFAARRTATARRSPRSAAASTASRWRSSSPRRGCVAMSPAEIAGAPRRAVPAAHRRPAHRGGAAPDAAGHRRLVVLAPRRATSGAVFDRLGVFAGTFDAAAATAVVAATASRRGTCSTRSRAWSPSRWSSSPTTAQARRARPATRCSRRCDSTPASSSTRRATADDVRRRHAEHFARVAEEAAVAFETARQIERRAQMRLELDDLRSAVTWGLERDNANDPEALVADPRPRWRTSRCSHGRTASVRGRSARSTPPGARPRRTPHRFSPPRAWALIWRGEYDEGLALAREALEQPDLEAAPGVSSAFAAEAVVLQNRGQFDDAMRSTSGPRPSSKPAVGRVRWRTR